MQKEKLKRMSSIADDRIRMKQLILDAKKLGLDKGPAYAALVKRFIAATHSAKARGII